MFTRLRAIPLRASSLFVLAGLLAGCGMEAVESDVRTAGERGVPDKNTLQVLEESYVCPHIMSPTGVVFDSRNVREGKVGSTKKMGETSVFGPYVPCATELQAGEGLCSTCQQPYHTPGQGQVAYCANLYIPSGEEQAKQCNNRLGDYSDGRSYDCSNCNKSVEHPRVTIEALPQFRCPYCNDIVDPVSVHRKHDADDPCPWHSQAHGSPDRFEPGHCGNCGNYFSTDPTDLLTTIDVVEELLCGTCGEPVDPSLNGCANASCSLGGVIHQVEVVEGPCWRCGGTKICPECGGSGNGTSGTYGSGGTVPSDCWFCYTPNVVDRSAQSTGRCPECDWDGFAGYVGALPPGFKTFQAGPDGVKSLPSSQRGWKFPQDERFGGGGGGEDEGGGE
jgi:DNA-directed RNA polymerase subunit RPC12/RpoP